MIIEMTVSPCSDIGHKPIALLVPEPPDTRLQRFIKAASPDVEVAKRIRERESDQWAYTLWEGLQNEISLRFFFREGLSELENKGPVFHRFDNSYTRADKALQSCLAKLVSDCVSEEDIVTALVDFIWSRFDYGPKNDALRYPAYFDQLAIGNCIDINTYLLSALYWCDIKSAYLAGYFFPNSTPGDQADGMHCWITTLIGNVISNWDIAQGLIEGLPSPVERLNPVGGCRAAFSFGRGLVFNTLWGATAPISHFARPQWLHRDLSVQEAEVSTRLISPPLSNSNSTRRILQVETTGEPI